VTAVTVRLSDGRAIKGETIDLSSGGTAIRLVEPLEVTSEEQAKLSFPLPSVEADLPVTLVSSEGTILRTKFNDLSIQEQELLTMVLYSRADTWLGWGESREIDQPMKSLARIFAISMQGLKMTFMSLFFKEKPAKGKAASKKKSNVAATRAAHTLLLLLMPLALLGILDGKPAQAQPGTMGYEARQAIAKGTPPPPGQFRDVFSLAEAGSSPIEMHGIDSQHSIFFTLQQTHVVKTAKIHIYYAFSPSLLPQLSHIQLSLNGTLFATLPVPPNQTPGSAVTTKKPRSPSPAELLVRKNILTIEFIGHYVMTCEDPANTTLWARVATRHLFGFQRRRPSPHRRSQAIALAFPRHRSRRFAQAPGRLSHRAFAQGYAGCRRRQLLLRHGVGEPPGPLSHLHRPDSRGKFHRHRRESRQHSRRPESGAHHWSHGSHAAQSRRPVQQSLDRHRPGCRPDPDRGPGRRYALRHARRATVTVDPTTRLPDSVPALTQLRAGPKPTAPSPCGITPTPSPCKATAPRPSTSISAFHPTSSTASASPTQS
jgi:hypothetical protein